MKTHVHPEAFALMAYQTEDGLESEIIWNSRDGVTPFIVLTRDSGKHMRHVRWNEDVFAPNHQPKPGDRIFVDMTPELMRESTEKYIEKYWNDDAYPMRESFETKEEAFRKLSKFNPGDPAIVTVR